MRHSPSLRSRLLILSATCAGLLGLAAAPAAALAMAPGDNGDVKIHAATTATLDQRNQTHVCLFYLDAFNFDGLQQVSWSIAQQPPTGRTRVSSGDITLGPTGQGRTTDMSLPAGHYKLTWTFAGEHGKAKSKVFWSTCHGKPSVNPSAKPSAPSSGGPGGKLAATGGQAPGWLGIAIGMLAAGGALVRRARESMRRN